MMNTFLAYALQVISVTILVIGWVHDWRKQTSQLLRNLLICLAIIFLGLSLLFVYRQIAEKEAETAARIKAEETIESINARLSEKPDLSFSLNDFLVTNDAPVLLSSDNGKYPIIISVINNGPKSATMIQVKILLNIRKEKIICEFPWSIGQLTVYEDKFADALPEYGWYSIDIPQAIHQGFKLNMPVITILDAKPGDTADAMITIASLEAGVQSRQVTLTFE